MRKKTVKLSGIVDCRIPNKINTQATYSNEDGQALYDAVYAKYLNLYESINAEITDIAKKGDTKAIEGLSGQFIAGLLFEDRDIIEDKTAKRHEALLSLALRFINRAGAALESKDFTTSCEAMANASYAMGGAAMEKSRIERCRNGGKKSKANEISARTAGLEWLLSEENNKDGKNKAALKYAKATDKQPETVRNWLKNK